MASEELREALLEKCGELKAQLLKALADGDLTRTIMLYLVYKEFCRGEEP